MIEELEQRAKGRRAGLPTGYPEIDTVLSGFLPGDLAVIAAVPGGGKTALALNIARHAVLESGVGVGFVSAEMTREQLVTRLLNAIALVETTRTRTGQFGKDESGHLLKAGGILIHAPLYCDDTPVPTIDDVTARCRALKADHPDIGLLVVDYIQLLRGERDDDARALSLDRIANGLKALAKELRVPVIATAQVDAKNIEKRENKRPRVADIAWSQGIRQAADFVALAYRPRMYDPSSPDTLELTFEKARELPVFTATLEFVGQYMLVESAARRARRGAGRAA